MIHITIDGYVLKVKEHMTVLEAALEAGIYIPHLCFHPALGSSLSLEPRQRIYHGETVIDSDSEGEWRGCNLCLAEIEGAAELQNSCKTRVEDGMVVHTDSKRVHQRRRQNLAMLLKRHPHACISCHLAEGCDRKICSMDIPEEQRCCWKFHHCEFRKIASWIGFEEGADYEFRQFPLINDNPLFTMNANLCVQCLRCVIACRDIAKREALAFVHQGGEVRVGTSFTGFKASRCKFCLVCIDVCPTGALKEKDPQRKQSRIRLGIPSAILPPEEDESILLSALNLGAVPDKGGVYRLYDIDKNIIQITGSENLKKTLTEDLENTTGTIYFSYEEAEMFMMRERQLIQQYMEQYGDLPPKNREIDDLFEE